jgi:hypothetical protein
VATISTGDVIELTCIGSYLSQTILNVFHYKYSGPLIGTGDYAGELGFLIQNFHDLVWDFGAGSWRSNVSQNFTLKSIRAQKVQPTREYYQQTNYADIGQQVGTDMPANVALGISFFTDRAFRGASGSKRFAGLISDQLNGGLVKPATQVLWTPAANAMTLVISGGALTHLYAPTIWSRKRAADRSNILSFVVRDTARTQHRRTVGLGI